MLLGEGRRAGGKREADPSLSQAEDETKLREKHRPGCYRISLYPGMEVTLPLPLTTTETLASS